MFYGKVSVHALQHRCLLTPSPSPSLYPMHPGLIIAHLGPAHVFVRHSAINLSYHRNSISVANLRGVLVRSRVVLSVTVSALEVYSKTSRSTYIALEDIYGVGLLPSE
jgi:hypothetical protein